MLGKKRAGAGKREKLKRAFSLSSAPAPVPVFSFTAIYQEEPLRRRELKRSDDKNTVIQVAEFHATRCNASRNVAKSRSVVYFS